MIRTVCVLLALSLVAGLPLHGQSVAHRARRLAWSDVAPIQSHLEARGVSAQTFDDRIARIAADNARRIRVGDLDHLVFYLLQSVRYTSLPPIEPALSARALLDGLDVRSREAFFRDPSVARSRVSRAVRARVQAFLRAVREPGQDARLAYFGRLLAAEAPPGHREVMLVSEYLRVMRFVYEKEFGAGRATPAAAAELYRTRGLSTDTAVEAGFLVAQAAGILRGLDPQRRVRRILIIGAGLDLAPRTALLEAAPPQSYQPWAVLDALVGVGLSTLDDVEIVVADINPRVVDHLQEARTSPPLLQLVSGLREDGRVSLSAGYREYFATLGRAIGVAETGPAHASRAPDNPAGHLSSRVQVTPAAARVVHAVRLDAVTERLDRRFDLVVATNVFPYFDDDALALALTNIAGMLDPGGVLLHNEARPALHALAPTLGLPSSHSRHAVIATVEGAAPLGDSVWLHERAAAARR